MQYLEFLFTKCNLSILLCFQNKSKVQILEIHVLTDEDVYRLHCQAGIIDEQKVQCYNCNKNITFVKDIPESYINIHA